MDQILLYDGSKDLYCVNSLKIYSNGIAILPDKITVGGDNIHLDLSNVRIYKEYIIMPWYYIKKTNSIHFSEIFRKHDNDARSLCVKPDGVIVNGAVCNYMLNTGNYRLCGIYDVTGLYKGSDIIDNPLAYYVQQHNVTDLNGIDIDFGRLLINPVNGIFWSFVQYSDMDIITVE